ncbi:MAG: DUF302 domain-containing protein [Candidatus Eremiobacteraeota bacterium]|nr:DUF302 domain-containing protein [Candidatus Eremiobacteraeota bacterium]
MKDSGNTVFAMIDQAEAAAKVGLTLRPTTLIVFGNPKGGTPLMEALPLIALELPLKMLVWEENGTVNVSYVPMSEIAARYGAKGLPWLKPSTQVGGRIWDGAYSRLLTSRLE